MCPLIRPLARSRSVRRQMDRTARYRSRCRRRRSLTYGIALLAEGDALPQLVNLAKWGEVNGRPTVAEELQHCRLVFIGGEERVGVGGDTPERDQVAGAISEAEAADESWCVRQPLKEFGGLKPERGSLPIDEFPYRMSSAPAPSGPRWRSGPCCVASMDGTRSSGHRCQTTRPHGMHRPSKPVVGVRVPNCLRRVLYLTHASRGNASR
jgi:hypothetical protein